MGLWLRLSLSVKRKKCIAVASTSSAPEMVRRRSLCQACQSRTAGNKAAETSQDFKNDSKAGFFIVLMMTSMMLSGSSRQSMDLIDRARIPNSWSAGRVLMKSTFLDVLALLKGPCPTNSYKCAD